METTIKRLRKSFKMTAAELAAVYTDAKQQIDFYPPTRISPRCKWRVKKFPFGATDIYEDETALRLFPEDKELWLHRRGGWYRSTKAEVAKILAGYGLTVEDFITAALQSFWIDFETRCGNTEHAYLKKRFPYAFGGASNA